VRDASADDSPPSFAVHRDARGGSRADPGLCQQVADERGRDASAWRFGRSRGAPPPPALAICAVVYQTVLSLEDALTTPQGKVSKGSPPARPD
jgi:hypothetical protein